MKNTTVVYYQLATGFTGEVATSFDPQVFDSENEAEYFWEKEYKLRNKKDGYDAHWNAIPFRCQQIKKITKQLW